MKMRRLNISLFLLSVMMLGASCSDNNDEKGIVDNGKASLTISLKGQPTSRSIGDASANPKVESVVSNFTVFVFNYSTGSLEKSGSFNFSENNLTGSITDLSTGTKKKIVTLVNIPTGLDISSIKAYTDLNNNLITLESQNGADLDKVGLFMSGEAAGPITLSEGDNKITIPVSRRVAKVVLKSLKINSVDDANFKLTNVSVQKARLNGTPIGDIVQPTGDVASIYGGGIASPDGSNPNFSTVYKFLSETLPTPATYTSGTNIITPKTEERYFYVLPNDASTNNPTLLTLSGVYGPSSSDAYYPFVINGSTGQGSTDGTYVKSNKIYEISVIINHPDAPSYDPNILPSKGVLEVTITPQDWEVPIEQNVEW